VAQPKSWKKIAATNGVHEHAGAEHEEHEEHGQHGR
jgi:hypothetical protein